MSRRRAFTMVELAVAMVVGSVIFVCVVGGVRSVARPGGRSMLTLDQMQELTIGSETIEREVREARRVIHPAPGDPPSRALVLRTFGGHIVTYFYDSARRELAQATLSPSNVAGRARQAPAHDLDGVYFSVSREDLVTWGIFVRETAVLGSARRQNQ
jgi:prepilin-type N-terminal cleavage/methylation domain-containing protein